MPLDPSLMLAATTGPDYMKGKLQQQTLRSAMLQNDQAAATNPQILQENAQKIALNDQATKEGDLRLLTAQQDQEDGKNLRDRLRAASQAQAAPAPAAPTAQVAGPQSAITPGMVGVAAGPPAAPARPQTYDDVADQFQQSGAQPRNVFAFRNMILGTKEKAAALQKTLSDTSKTQQEVDDKTRDFEASLASGVKDSGYNPSAMEGALHAAEANPSSAPHAAAIRQALAGGASIQSIIDPMVDAATAAQTTAFAHKTTAQTAAQKEVIEAPGQKATAEQAVRVNNATKLSAAKSPEEAQAILDGLPHGEAKIFPAYDPANPQAWAKAVQQVALTPEQKTTAAQQQSNAAETARHNLSDESIKRVQAAISGGHLAQVQMVNGLKYGPGTQEYWVKQLSDNPDSVKEMPPELRSSVGQAFRQSTGLPLPTPLSGATLGSETAARNALDGAAFIQKAMQNPEIRANLGPIMGRLGDAQQSIGSAPNLSPQAAQLAQELRTRMRYFVFQEGKAVLGGRMPQELMKKLESSSPNVAMSPSLLMGALSGAKDNALSVMDNADKQRFGGHMRTREMRGVDATPAAAAQASPGSHTVGDMRTFAGANYKFDGKQWVKQ